MLESILKSVSSSKAYSYARVWKDDVCHPTMLGFLVLSNIYILSLSHLCSPLNALHLH